MTRRRLVGVDYGTKRVGLALADPLRLFAQPYAAASPEDAVRLLQRLHEEEGIEALVVGWPLSEDGTENAMTARVQQYINRLKKRLPGVEVVTWDERYTSEAAKDAIRAAGTARRASRDKGRIDAAAAALLLQDYLDR